MAEAQLAPVLAGRRQAVAGGVVGEIAAHDVHRELFANQLGPVDADDDRGPVELSRARHRLVLREDLLEDLRPGGACQLRVAGIGRLLEQSDGSVALDPQLLERRRTAGRGVGGARGVGELALGGRLSGDLRGAHGRALLRSRGCRKRPPVGGPRGRRRSRRERAAAGRCGGRLRARARRRRRRGRAAAGAGPARRRRPTPSATGAP